MKYLFFDIDGTLVSHGTGLIPSAKEAIEKSRAKGNKVFISTGRHLASLQEIKALDVDGYIFCNGGGIMIDGEIVSTSPIIHDLCSKTVFQAEERNAAYTLLSSNVAFMNPTEIARLKSMQFPFGKDASPQERMKRFGAVPFSEYRYEDILKIDIRFDSEEVMDDFITVMDEDLHLAANAGFNFEFGRKSGELTRRGVNKGAAVKRVVELLGGSMEDTFGFGDSNNDLEMIDACHTGIAMGNGLDSVKEIADFVTKDIAEDGIAYAMEHFDLV